MAGWVQRITAWALAPPAAGTLYSWPSDFWSLSVDTLERPKKKKKRFFGPKAIGRSPTSVSFTSRNSTRSLEWSSENIPLMLWGKQPFWNVPGVLRPIHEACLQGKHVTGGWPFEGLSEPNSAKLFFRSEGRVKTFWTKKNRFVASRSALWEILKEFLQREGRIYRPEAQTYVQKGRLLEKEEMETDGGSWS